MNIVAFAGPSLTPEDRSAYPEIEWRPPAEAGDLLRLRAGKDTVVCLIDGYFDHRPAVRHKELLLLLSRGIRIFGASSIGALRAAEMQSFGMIGVGAIYRAYVRGHLTGDDEVALVHASERWDWKSLSVPLVDCRANVHRALRGGVLTAGEARSALSAARSAHYSDRDWPALLATADIPPLRRATIMNWVETHGVSQKRIDAIACLNSARKPQIRMHAVPPMVRTSLFSALAAECGLAPEELG